MNLLRIVSRIAVAVLVTTSVMGCAESQTSLGHEPRSAFPVAPHLDSTRSGVSSAPRYAGAPARIDRLRQ